jgi:TolB-like protein/Tfp pilus assembly protein PilF
VFYEALSGSPPFGGDTLPDKLAAVLKDEPQWDALPPETPASIRDLLRRCLEKDPGRRLADISIAKGILTTAFAGASRVSSRLTEAESANSIAVLPFTNMSPDPENEYFSDGITEEIISALAQQEDLRVAARTSCFSFKGKPAEIAEVGAKLNVATILEGSVRKAGNRVRITAQLINVADGYQLWSERYDRELHDIFEIQDKTAAAIVEKLRGKLTGEGGRVPVKRYTCNREAHDLYLKGRFHWNRRDRGGLQKGLDCFRKAAEIDPGYALAHVGIADAYWSLGCYALHPLRDALSRGREAVERALAIDERLPDAHATKGAISLMAGEWAPAEESFRRAIELDPRHGFAHGYYALFLSVLLRIEEMQEQIRIALEVDPLSHYHHGVAAIACWWTGNHEEAIRLSRRGLEIDPASFVCTWVYAAACCDVGDIAEGVRYLVKAMERSGRYPSTLGFLGYALGRQGQEDRARELLTELERRSSEEYISPVFPGLVLLGLGDRDHAHEMYVRAVDEGLARHILVMFGRPFPDLLQRYGIPTKPGR